MSIASEIDSTPQTHRAQRQTADRPGHRSGGARRFRISGHRHPGAAVRRSGALASSSVAMQRHLSALVAEIRHCADSIQTASTEVASGNQELSVRAERAASNLQVTSSSLLQLTTEAAQSADSANEACRLAADAAQMAELDGHLVAAVSSTMQDIHTSSARVAGITGVINASALQTKMLALNAAVEAARASEYGRGFSLVAGEVWELAARSATAGKEVGALIDASNPQISDGADRPASAGSRTRDPSRTSSEWSPRPGAHIAPRSLLKRS